MTSRHVVDCIFTNFYLHMAALTGDSHEVRTLNPQSVPVEVPVEEPREDESGMSTSGWRRLKESSRNISDTWFSKLVADRWHDQGRDCTNRERHSRWRSRLASIG